LYKKRNLGKDVASLIRSELWFTDAFIQSLRDLPFENPTPFAFLPENYQCQDVSLESPYPIDSDGSIGGWNAEIDYFLSRLTLNEKRAAFFHTVWYDSEASALKCEFPITRVGVAVPDKGHRVTFYIMSYRATFANIEAAFIRTSPYPFIASIADVPDHWETVPDVLSDQQARELARQTDTLFVEAFDDGAKVIWAR
jgi:hypothetical protein